MIGILLALVTRLMCGFCHAPEHAYDALLENPDISREGLCPEAQERLRMAATPYPGTYDDSFIWDEDKHDWRPYKHYAQCVTCGESTWRWANEEHALVLCAECARAEEARRNPRFTYWGAPTRPVGPFLPLPRQGPRPKGWLIFSDYEVRNTRDYEGIPGPRAYVPRPTNPTTPTKPSNPETAGDEDA